MPQREHDKFTHVSADPEAEIWEGEVFREDTDSGREQWAWRIRKAGTPFFVAHGWAATKPEAMRHFTLAFFGFGMTAQNELIKATKKDFAPENFEKYKDE